MQQTLIRVTRNAAGFALVALGLVGLFLPFLQGILFLVLGIGLVDLPIKHRAHAALGRWSWYRAIARQHHRVKRAIRRRRAGTRAIGGRE